MRSNREMEGCFQKKYEELMRYSEAVKNPEDGRADETSKLYQTYSIQTEAGRAFYRWLTDEMLLDVLRREAEKREHSPSQKEIFWVWREYIKERFHKWPYALEAARLSRAAGTGGKNLDQQKEEQKEYRQLVCEVRQAAEELCRIPHPSDVPELCEKIKKYTNNWSEVIRDADLSSEFFRNKSTYIIENLETEYREDLKKLRALAESLGRVPLKSELETETRKRLINRCGSWRNTLYQIGLEPIVRINPFSSTHIRKTEKERTHRSSLYDCYYRILNPTAQTAEDLETLYQIREALGHEPDKGEVAPELRKRLQAACGSFANALFQLNYRNKRLK